MCFYLVKRKSGLELTTTAQVILLKPLHAKERSVDRIPDKDGRLAIRVIEHLHADRSPSEMRLRAFDDAPDLDAVVFPNNIIGIEVEGHHLAWLDDLAVKLRKDSAFAIEKRPANNDGSGSGVGCRHPSGLAKSDADRAK